MSKIEWTDITWNPVTGCEKISPGCQNCYAEKMSKRLKHIPHSEKKYKNEFKVTCHPEELKRLWIKKPKKIFVCSMGDLFHEDVPFNFIDVVLNKIRRNPRHTFQVLTKRPFIALGFQELRGVKWPENLWFGVTAENQKEFENRVPLLSSIYAKNTFVSIEPMLEPIFIEMDYFHNGVFDWVIVGGETGQNARRMDADWARSIRNQCITHKVPFFFKQMSKKQPIPDDLLIKEFPKV